MGTKRAMAAKKDPTETEPKLAIRWHGVAKGSGDKLAEPHPRDILESLARVPHPQMPSGALNTGGGLKVKKRTVRLP